MTDPHAPRCPAFVEANASRANALLAGAAIEAAAEAIRHARGVGPQPARLRLVVRIAALRAHRDLTAALAAEGMSAPSASALAPQLERALGRNAPDAWVSITGADGVPAAEQGVVRRLGPLAIEAAAALAAPRAASNACVHVEPPGRGPAEPPWLGVLAARAGLFRMAEPEGRALLGEVRDRLVAARPGVRPWLQASSGGATTLTVRAGAGALTLAPFLVTDAATRAELEHVVLPDAALPAPVRRLRCAGAVDATPSRSGSPSR